MRKKMKNVLLAILAALMLFPGNHLTVEAADNTWTFEDGVLTFTGTGKITEDFYKEVPQEDIKKVVIGEGITEIEACCFLYCYNMEYVIFPESLKKIGTQAFDMCYALKEVTIPAGLEELGSSAFTNCPGIKKISILCKEDALGTTAFKISSEDVNGEITLVYMDEAKFAQCDAENLFRRRNVCLNPENGDVTCDKQINANDALEVLKYVASMLENDFYVNELGNYNGDENIDANDALAILKHVAGM